MSSVIHACAGRLRLKFSAVAICACLSAATILAQQAALSPARPGNRGIQWIPGPTKVSLGDTAELYVPAGFSYADADNSSAFLQGLTNPIPKNLMGVIRPDAGDWFAIMHFADIGYVKDAQKERLEPAKILESIRQTIDKQNQGVAGVSGSLVTGADWELQPSFNLAENRLEYAIKAANGGQAAVNHYINLLGRRGVLALTGVYRYTPDLDLTRLQNIAAGITFKRGEGYADYKAGDRISHSNLSQLVADDHTSSSLWPTIVEQAKSTGIWAGVGLALVFAGWRLTALGFNSRKRNRRIVRSNGSTRPAPRPVSNGEAHVGNGNGNGNGNGAAPMAPEPVAAKVQVRIPIENGKSASKSNSSQSRRRRKQFSYHAFYSDMVMSLTRCNYVGGFGTFAAENGEDASGTQSGLERPVPNVIKRAAAAASAAASVQSPAQQETASMLVQETTKLLESQQRLIEGQRKLIEEQTRLIQEKCKLLDVESRVLEKQSELFTDHELL